MAATASDGVGWVHLFDGVVLVVILGCQAPRSMLLARLGPAFRAWLSLGLRRAQSTLQVTRFLEAPMASFFHNGSRSETCRTICSLRQLRPER